MVVNCGTVRYDKKKRNIQLDFKPDKEAKVRRD